MLSNGADVHPPPPLGAVRAAPGAQGRRWDTDDAVLGRRRVRDERDGGTPPDPLRRRAARRRHHRASRRRAPQGRRQQGSHACNARCTPVRARPASASPRPRQRPARLQVTQLRRRRELDVVAVCDTGLRAERALEPLGVRPAYSLPRTPRRWRTSISSRTSSAWSAARNRSTSQPYTPIVTARFMNSESRTFPVRRLSDFVPGRWKIRQPSAGGGRRAVNAAPPTAPRTQEPVGRWASRWRSSIRRILPVSVFGRSVTNSIRRGYAYADR